MPDFNLNKAVEWPYPVNYGKENEAEADVLILGGVSPDLTRRLVPPNVGQRWWWWKKEL